MKKLTEVLILAVPETAGSALYGMVDVLAAAGNLWQTLTEDAEPERLFRLRIVSSSDRPFVCGNGIPVTPDCSIHSAPRADIVILPELWFEPQQSFQGLYPEIMLWLRERHRAGSAIYSACSGALMLAESGLLNGCRATSHWGYQGLFQRDYPQIEFMPEPNLVFADPAGRIVTAGGTTSWHDLALHIIARYASPGEALRIAKVYLLKWHGEGQIPFAPLVKRQPHADSVVRRAEDWLGEHYREEGAIATLVRDSGVAERTLKRRFRNATGSSLIEYLQNLRVEAAKRLLEQTRLAIDEISVDVGYEDASFFRRLFKRTTGLAPSEYRRMFQPVAMA
ncbi:helix-turn-helix domain-containing protein [Marinobacterium sp. D7]|uniref:GlxA family transcriptional regulator n=1 Tax=Marinobacterium ramblicola TaxID=2849041 RepID=UPI001C2D3143|nr:helix-turn-helix domain-containing protein [Marinobacterium ramblicola]